MSLADDSDLYGDLYGADDPDYNDGGAAVAMKDEPLEVHAPSPPAPQPAAVKSELDSASYNLPPTSSIPAKPMMGLGLPAKPDLAGAGNGPQPIPSYSSQVAQQFQSSYKQPQQSQSQPLGGGSDALVLGGGGGGAGGVNRAGGMVGVGLGASGPGASAEAVDMNAALGASVRPSQMKDEGKMFVGGLNWDTSDEGLRKYFSQFGKVDACTIMRDATGRSRGFAFLTFEDPAAVNAVMVREHYLDGKIIDPKRAIPRQEHHRTQKLFVGGLAPTVTTESLRAYFAQFGKVVDATVMVDRDSSRSKGFGFVTFEDIDNVERLLGIGLLEIDGKLIDVKLAQPRGAMIAQREQQGQIGGPVGAGGNGGAGGGMNSPNGGMAGMAGGMAGAMAGGGVMNAAAANTNGGGPNGNTPFDPQALAQLYQRMFQQFGGAQGMMQNMQNMMGGGMMNGGMGGMAGMMGGMGGAAGMAGMAGMGGMGGMGMGMNGAMGGMNAMGGAMGGMRGNAGMGAGMGAGMMRGAGAGGNMGGGGAGVGVGVGAGAGAGQGLGPNVPRGPRAGNGQAPPTGPAAMQNGGTGPMRAGNRGANNFHPYAR